MQNRLAIELRGISDALNLCLKILVLSVEIVAIRLSGSAVSRLQCKLTHALQHIGNLYQGTICRLNHTNGIVCIANAHFQAFYLRSHPRRNSESRSIILCAVYALTGRQALHGGIHLTLVANQCVLRNGSVHIGIYNCHDGLLALRFYCPSLNAKKGRSEEVSALLKKSLIFFLIFSSTDQREPASRV